MSKTMWWILAVLLVGGGLYLIYGFIPSRQSTVAKRGVKSEGQVLLKDIRPNKQGSVDRMVTLVYRDDENRNHQVENIVDDEGLYDSLKANQYVTVYYLPEDKSKAFMQGAYAIVTRSAQMDGPVSLTVVSIPRVSAWRFLGWSMVIAGIVAGVYAWFKPKPEKKSQTGPAVTVTRR
jgi:hypothetical protein